MGFNNLYFKVKEQWKLLPLWCQFFSELGYTLGTYEDSGKRLVVGVALPIRAYAASFTAIGVITGKLALSTNKNEDTKYFQQLLTLAHNTQLNYRRENGKLVKVTFDGFTSDASMIKLRSAKCIYEISSNRALRVEFPNKEPPMSLGQSHKRITNTQSPFLSHFFDKNAAEEIIKQSRLDCLIIGSIKQIEQEVNHSRFAVRTSSGGQFLEGALQEIIRVRKFSTNAETYRTDIFYTHSKETHLGSPYEIPHVVIFDGAKSYLKWEANYRSSHCIVLLPQTETDFDAAIQNFNENYLKHHINDTMIKTSLQVPTGIPISFYQEMRK